MEINNVKVNISFEIHNVSHKELNRIKSLMELYLRENPTDNQLLFDCLQLDKRPLIVSSIQSRPKEGHTQHTIEILG